MRKICALLVVGMLVGAVAGTAGAGSILVDRGLPTQNVNWAAGADRSNVGWADAESPPSTMIGDDFTLPATASAYTITDLRVWVVDPYDTPGTDPSVMVARFNSLSLGLRTSGSGGAFTFVSSTPTVTGATFFDGSTEQGNSGAFRAMYQLDFAVNITAAAGSKFDFALNAVGNVDPRDTFGQFGTGTTAYYLAWLETAAWPDSGKAQNGSDSTFYVWDSTTGAVDGTFNPNGTETWDGVDYQVNNRGGDVDIQVLGDVAVPEPLTMFAVFGGLSMLGGYIRQRRAA